jgi:ABC-2 type transport system ATP-binding protein
MNETPAISVEHMSLRYGGVTALDDVTLSVERGSVLAVVGRNGAGKSSLLQCMLGLTVPQSGNSQLLGCPSLDLTDDVKARLGYVSQSPELFEWLRVGEQISLIGGLYPNWSESRARALCARFSIADDMKVRTLSLGEKQRLAIVIALAHQPDLLVFDEPVASLDPVGRRDFLRALFEHEARDGEPVTVVISSHLLEDLERIATHVLFLDKGRVQLMGARDELAERVQLAVTRHALAPQTGLLKSRQLAADQWQYVVDTRALAEGALPPNTALRALSLGDLFEALNT